MHAHEHTIPQTPTIIILLPLIILVSTLEFVLTSVDPSTKLVELTVVQFDTQPD